MMKMLWKSRIYVNDKRENVTNDSKSGQSRTTITDVNIDRFQDVIGPTDA